MMNILLFVILLNNRLFDELLCGNINDLLTNSLFILCWFNYFFLFNNLLRKFVKFDFNRFFLNSWLSIVVIINLFCRFIDRFDSFFINILSFFNNILHILSLRIIFINFDDFSVINNSFVINRLSDIFFSRNIVFFIWLVNFCDCFFDDRIMVYDLSFSSYYFNILSFSMNCRLDVLFFNDKLTRNFNRNIFYKCFFINNRIF